MTAKPPWAEYRDIAEAMGATIADAVQTVIGANTELGVIQAYAPETMVSGVSFPQRAVVVRFANPARDVLIVLTSLGAEQARKIAEASAVAVLTAFDIPMHDHAFIVEPALEYATLDDAVDRWDALFLEATYDISLQLGDMRVVLGTALLEAVSYHARGLEAPAERTHETMGTSIGLEGDEAYAITDASADSSPLSAASLEPSILDQLDAELAAEEALAGEPAVTTATSPAPVVAQPQSAAGDTGAQTAMHTNSTRWASLLSGVEVELSAELGRTDLALGDITALDADSVLTLDQMVNEPVTVYVNGTPYATARLVVVDGEYGIEIIEVIEQLPLLGSLAA
ncbi:MAG: fliN [Thermoleophilia bacterium]|nr:fliN [Thermoleophilia bacterium]